MHTRCHTFLRSIATVLLFTLCVAQPKSLIETVTIDGQRITYDVAQDLRDAYIQESFYAVYPDTVRLDMLDESILTIPFIASIIPIVWISGNTYTIQTMDEDLYYALKRIHTVFKIFYPSVDWHGELIPEKLSKNSPRTQQPDHEIALLFSHGLDAVYSSLRNNDNHQLLITIWGSDVRPSQAKTWHNVKNLCQQYATDHGHGHTWIQSNLTTFVTEQKIVSHYPALKSWWGKTSQDLSYCGLTAPLLYSQGITHLAMAATNTIQAPYPYGSHPLIGNNLQFCGIRVHHDNPATRTEKIRFIKNHCAQQQESAPLLRVCWGHYQGGNCLQCEKCWRTVISLLFEEQDPRNYGFNAAYDQALAQALRMIPKANTLYGVHLWFWHGLQKEAQDWLSSNPSPLKSPMHRLCSLIATRKFQAKSHRPYPAQYTTLLQALWQKSMTGTLTDQDLQDALHVASTVAMKHN